MSILITWGKIRLKAEPFCKIYIKNGAKSFLGLNISCGQIEKSLCNNLQSKYHLLAASKFEWNIFPWLFKKFNPLMIIPHGRNYTTRSDYSPPPFSLMLQSTKHLFIIRGNICKMWNKKICKNEAILYKKFCRRKD